MWNGNVIKALEELSRIIELHYLLVIVISLPRGVVVLHIIVSGVARHQCARPHPRKRSNYDITCYLGNFTVEERYGQHS